jgi:SAM-dependent methyltransferase
MGRFASTVAYYENARPPYGAAFFAAAAERLGFDRSQRLLDVGAGSGLLAIGFAPYCREVVGVDPEPAMMEAARAAASRAGVAAVFIEGRFEDKAAGLGAFDVVTIGRAIHWLDPGPPDEPSIALSNRSAGFSSAMLRASTKAATPGSTRSTRCAIAVETTALRMIPTLFSQARRSFRVGRLASRRRPPFPSNAWQTAFCRCRPHRLSGSATRFRR